jgi:hypothetical protein
VQTTFAKMQTVIAEGHPYTAHERLKVEHPCKSTTIQSESYAKVVYMNWPPERIHLLAVLLLFSILTACQSSPTPSFLKLPGQIALVSKQESHIFNIAIKTTHANGDNFTRLTDDGQTTALAWSPDSQHIAFVSSRDERCGQEFLDRPPFCTNALYVMDANGNTVHLLRQEQERITALDWSF